MSPRNEPTVAAPVSPASTWYGSGAPASTSSRTFSATFAPTVAASCDV
jgi:hypothetical protein